jgi:hypothetical protein
VTYYISPVCFSKYIGNQGLELGQINGAAHD